MTHRWALSSEDEDEVPPMRTNPGPSGPSKGNSKQNSRNVNSKAGGTGRQEPDVAVPACHAEKYLHLAIQARNNEAKKQRPAEPIFVERANGFAMKKKVEFNRTNKISKINRIEPDSEDDTINLKPEEQMQRNMEEMMLEEMFVNVRARMEKEDRWKAQASSQQKEKAKQIPEREKAAPMVAGPSGAQRDPHHLNEQDAVRLGDLIKNLAHIQFPKTILLDDLLQMMETVEPRFVSIQLSGFNDHAHFLELFCPSVKLFIIGSVTNLLWDSNHGKGERLGNVGVKRTIEKSHKTVEEVQKPTSKGVGVAKGVSADRNHPGGFELVKKLGNYAVDPIVKTAVKLKLDSSAAVVDKDEMNQLISKLKNAPWNLEEYLDKQRVYNQLQTELELDDLFNDPKLHCLPGLFNVEMAPIDGKYEVLAKWDIQWNHFCREHKINSSSRLAMFPTQGEPTRVTVTFIDQNVLMVTPELSEKNHLKYQVDYQMCLLPSSLNFRSKCRALATIEDSHLHRMVFPEVPMNAVSTSVYQEYETQEMSRWRSVGNGNRFNTLQRASIIAILNGLHGELPYLLFGPPGTGKTTTLVEAVRQIHQQDPDKRILVCAPSNSAADLFAKQLLKTNALPKEKILRVNAVGKSVEMRDMELEDVYMIVNSGNDSERVFGIPPKKKLLDQYRVVICTLSTSTYLVSGGLRGAFDHIIIDEAGQADELESLIPIAGLTDQNTRVVLAGDPRQLGPIEPSQLLKRFYLNQSMLERFIKRDCYSGDKRFMCMLEENYRSHHQIIRIPSQLFYGGKVRASAPADLKDTLCNYRRLATKDFPIIFHSVAHRESFEQGGYSCRNEKEAAIVVEYVKDILHSTDVLPEQIGIISPYNFQCKHIRQLLAKNACYRKIVVDSVEKFQGSERRVILVSTVRNNGTGFLDCDKRFNTTITRAQEMLIVVGNHKNLLWIPSWRAFIGHCQENNVLFDDSKT